MIKLSELLRTVVIQEWIGPDDINISGLDFDTRRIQNGSVFVAQKGYSVDGHDFIQEAIKKGAVVILCEYIPANPKPGIIYLKLDNTREALGLIASELYGNPSSKLKLVGITGTNGKTTIATVLYKLFIEMGYKAGLISTVNNYINTKKYQSTHTTPDPLQIQSLLSKMVSEGCEYCFLEVSSHAVVQHRICGIEFAGGIFSNISRDHLDFHKNFNNYIKAKKSFFDILPSNAFALVNNDDKNAKVILQNTRAKKFSYSIHGKADFMCKVIESHFDSMNLEIEGTEIWTPLIGIFNASNLLAVYGSALLLGQKRMEILKNLSKIQAVRGRFEYIKLRNKVIGIIDYAHTPDALKNVLETINQIKKKKEKIITVVGAGGDRDKDKRPEMGRIAAILSDRVILTSDNPRSEDPVDIISDMESGIEKNNIKKTLKIPDRKEAIKTACILASQGDIILVAGKGHEDYQEINGEKKHFDDREILKEIDINL